MEETNIGNHLNKPAYRSKSENKQTNKTKQKKTYCNRDDKQKEKQKDKHEDVKKGLQNHRMWGRKLRKQSIFFLIMCLSLYDYQGKASRYRKGLTYLKNKDNHKSQPNITFTKTKKKRTQA